MTASFANIRNVRVDGRLLPAAPPAAAAVRSTVAEILRASPLCAWSTVTETGAAHVNIGHFAYSDDFRLYLISHPASQHCVNVRAHASMAVAVFESGQEWGTPGRGVQLFGACHEVAASDEPEARLVYGRRFSAYADWEKTLQPGDLPEEYRFYAFVPRLVKIMDERQFGDAVLVVADIVRAPADRPTVSSDAT